jgi:hypothetical protein
MGFDLIKITYTNGTSVTYGAFICSPNLSQLKTALSNAVGTISQITIKGHASPKIQSFGNDFITMNSTGKQILASDETDITCSLNRALAPGAWIYLAGLGYQTRDDYPMPRQLCMEYHGAIMAEEPPQPIVGVVRTAQSTIANNS